MFSFILLKQNKYERMLDNIFFLFYKYRLEECERNKKKAKKSYANKISTTQKRKNKGHILTDSISKNDIDERERERA